MYAVVEIGGKQEIVKEKDVLEVMKLPGAKEKGMMQFEKVLLKFTDDGKNVEVGTPYVSGAKVKTKVIRSVLKDDKIVGGKFKRRKRYTRLFGHRQVLSEIEVEKIG